MPRWRSRTCRPTPPAHLDLLEIRRSVARASKLTRQLLAFGRKQVLQPTVLDLGKVVAETHAMLRRMIPEYIEIEVHTEEEVWVEADSGQLEQVLANLAVNARDAMEDGGRLSIEVRRAVEEEIAALPELGRGDYAVLEVADSGRGIPAEVLPNIFEPFFTTKPLGKGTGLGLSTVYGIIEQSGGQIVVESNQGTGTTFRVYLPRCAAPRARPQPKPEPVTRTAGGTILLVEDEGALRALLARVLKRQGYNVLEAPDPPTALTIAETHGHIDLLMTDVVMPHMNGPVLAQQIRRLKPDITVLFMSGYSPDVTDEIGLAEEDTNFLQKPFTIQNIIAKVGALLAG